MRPLTLEQVKQAGRFAWQDVGAATPFYNPYTGELCEFSSDGIVPYGEVSGLHAEPYTVRAAPQWGTFPASSDTGWYHLPGCDCEFCQGVTP